MKNKELKLVKYFSGEMSLQEQAEFLKEINSSTQLKEEMIRYEKLFSNIKRSASTEASLDYFGGIVPEFRKRLEEKNRSYISLKLASGITAGAAAVILIVIFIFTGQQKSFDELITGLNENEISILVEEMDIDVNIPDEGSGDRFNDIDAMYYEAMDLNDDNGNIIHSEYISDAAVYNSITEDESEMIFTELINKELLRY